MGFAELFATSNFTFLTGASHPEEYAREAAALGLTAIAIADRNSVAGVVRAHQALKELAREVAEGRTPAPGDPAPLRVSDNIGDADVAARAEALALARVLRPRRAGPLRDPRDDSAAERAARAAALRGAERGGARERSAAGEAAAGVDAVGGAAVGGTAARGGGAGAPAAAACDETRAPRRHGATREDRARPDLAHAPGNAAGVSTGGARAEAQGGSDGWGAPRSPEAPRRIGRGPRGGHGPEGRFVRARAGTLPAGAGADAAEDGGEAPAGRAPGASGDALAKPAQGAGAGRMNAAASPMAGTGAAGGLSSARALGRGMRNDPAGERSAAQADAQGPAQSLSQTDAEGAEGAGPVGAGMAGTPVEPASDGPRKARTGPAPGARPAGAAGAAGGDDGAGAGDERRAERRCVSGSGRDGPAPSRDADLTASAAGREAEAIREPASSSDAPTLQAASTPQAASAATAIAAASPSQPPHEAQSGSVDRPALRPPHSDGPTRPAPPVFAPVAPQSLPRLIPAALLALEDGQELVALPVDRAGWSRLTRLLTVGKRRADKGECRLTEADVIAHAEGLILLWRAPDPLPAPAASGAEGWLAEAAGSRRPAAPPRRRPARGASAGGAARSDGPASGAGARPNAPRGFAPEPPLAPTGDSAPALAAAPAAALPLREKAGDAAGPSAPAPHAPPSQGGAGAPSKTLARWTRRLPGQVFCLAAPAYDGRDAARLDALAATAEAAGAPLVASAAPLMHRAARRRLADVLACIREGTTIDRLGRLAQPNAERRLRAEAELRRIFGPHAHAVDRAAEIAGRCRFALTELAYEYPDEVSRGENPQSRLERLTEEGLALRYPDGPPPRVRAQADHELALIGRLNYAPYFLTVRDLVAFAESRGILCQGRGSAANSIVCYALRVTSIGPEIASMVFERFVSEARDEPPDIDVDFEHERREEVIQHIYARYGRHRAGLCATVIHYRARRAIREVGRAMGLSADAIGALASQVWGWSADAIRDERIREVGLDPGDPRLALTLDLVAELIGFPRHLSQHVGGFIITKGRLDELVPIENAAMEDRTVIEWDKDDIDALGILKVDVLSLGMLTCVRKAFELIERHGGPRWDLATLPPEDPEVYDMLCEADSVGVFQVESRAQMNFLPRMRPRCFYDLVIEVAIVRPGPIQGDMVHPYLRRRRGEEVVTFPSDELGEVLGKTLGVPLFQEQAMQIAIIGAGFSPEEADRLRRALATFRKSGTIGDFRARFLAGMTANGYEADFAERCFSQIEGFGEYGFPESHAASFALLVYASAWLKRRHPAAFACALLNAQPMGFYAPAQIVRDARGHGVEVRPVCVNASYWDNVLEPAPGSTSGFALRLGFRQIKAMKEEDAAWLSAARGNGYRSAEDVWRRAGLGPAAIAVLAEADAFAGLGLGRRDALWQAKAISGEAPLPLFEGLLEGEGIEEPPTLLPAMTEAEEVVEDYVALRLTLRAHPLALLRSRLSPGFEGLALAGGAGAGGVEPPAPAGPAGRGARIAGGAPGSGGALGGSLRDGKRRIASPGQGEPESLTGAGREGEEQRGDRLAPPSSSAQAHGSRPAQEEDGAPSPARRHLAARRRPLPKAPREGAEGPALAQGGDAWRGRAETGRPPAPGADVFSGGTDPSDRVAPPSPPTGAPEAGEAGAPGREPSPSRLPSRGEPRAEGAVPARLPDMSGGGRTAAPAEPSAEIADACMRGPDEQGGAPSSGRAAGGLRRDPSAGPELAAAGDGRAPRVGRPPVAALPELSAPRRGAVPGRGVSAGLRDAPGGGRGRAREREDAAREARPELSGAGASVHGGGADAFGSTEPASARPDWPRPPACLPAGFLHLPPERARVAVCGLVIVRQRPGSAGGVVFATLEDETGVVNVVIWQRVYEAFRREIIAGRLMRVLGRVQRDGKVVHVVAERIEDLSAMLDDLGRGARTMPDPAGPTDEARRPLPEGRGGGGVGGVRAGGGGAGGAGARHPRHQARKLFPSRDFH